MNAAEIVAETLLTGELLVEMNVVNPKQLKTDLKHYQSQTNSSEGKKWWKRQAYNYMVNAPEEEREALGFRPFDPEVDIETFTDPEKGVPEWLQKAMDDGEELFVYTQGHNEEKFIEVVNWMNTDRRGARNVDNASWPDVMDKVENYDPESAELDNLLADEKAKRADQASLGNAEQEASLLEIGVKVVYRFDDGYYWAELVPTPREQQGQDDKTSGTPADTYGSRYKALRDESYVMSSGKGDHSFCVGSGRYGHDNALTSDNAAIYSLRSPDNVAHVTMYINNGSISDLKGANNTYPPAAKYTKHCREFIVHLGIRPGASYQQAMGLVSDSQGQVHQVENIPDGVKIQGSLDFSNMRAGEFRMPKNLTVEGDLRLTGTGISELPEGLSVTGSIYLKGTGVTKLPEDLMCTQMSWDDETLPMSEIKKLAFRRALEPMQKAYYEEQHDTFNELAALAREDNLNPQSVIEAASDENSRMHGWFSDEEDGIDWETEGPEADAWRVRRAAELIESVYRDGSPLTDEHIDVGWSDIHPKLANLFLETDELDERIRLDFRIGND